MKHLTTGALAAAVIAVLLATFAVASSSATVLCKVNEIPCPENEDIPKGTKIEASLETKTSSIFRQTSGFVLNECTAGTIAGETTTTGNANETVKVKLTNLTFGSCTRTTHVLEVGELEIHYATGPSEPPNQTKGTATVKNIAVTIQTIFDDCVYGAGEWIDMGTITSSPIETEGATIDVAARLVLEEGAACVGDLLWEATYRITAPLPLYVKPL